MGDPRTAHARRQGGIVLRGTDRALSSTAPEPGHTPGIETAVSIPDAVFSRPERYARRVSKSRSRIVSEALQEYLARHSPDEVTEAMDHAMSLIQEPRDRFVSSAARRTLEQVEW